MNASTWKRRASRRFRSRRRHFGRKRHCIRVDVAENSAPLASGARRIKPADRDDAAFGAPDPERQIERSKNRANSLRDGQCRCRVGRIVGLGIGAFGMKQGLEIDRNREIGGGDHVLIMKVDPAHRMEQRQQAAGTAMEKHWIAAALGFVSPDKGGPAIALAHQHSRSAQRNRGAPRAKPVQQTEPSLVDPQVLGLVDELAAVAEAKDRDRAAAVMRVRQVGLEATRGTQRGTIEKGFGERATVAVKPLDQFRGAIKPMRNRRTNQPCRDRVREEEVAATPLAPPRQIQVIEPT